MVPTDFMWAIVMFTCTPGQTRRQWKESINNTTNIGEIHQVYYIIKIIRCGDILYIETGTNDPNCMWNSSNIWFKYDLGQKYYVPCTYIVFWTINILNKKPSSTVHPPSSTGMGLELKTSRLWQYIHVTMKPALTTRPLMTLLYRLTFP